MRDLCLPAEKLLVPRWCVIAPSHPFFFYPPSISEVIETPELSELVFHVHINPHTYTRIRTLIFYFS